VHAVYCRARFADNGKYIDPTVPKSPWWQRPAILSHKMQWATYITRYGWSIGFVNDLREHAVSAFLVQIHIQECVCCVCVFVCVCMIAYSCVLRVYNVEFKLAQGQCARQTCI